MSGGHFDYKQYELDYIADSIDEYINGREIEDEDIQWYLEDHCLSDDEKEYVRRFHRTMPNNEGFNQNTINEFKKGIYYLRKAAIYAQRIDWLLSADDGEETFHKRLKEELKELKDENL